MKDKQKQVAKYTKEMEKHARKKKLREARRKTARNEGSKKPRLKKISIKDWDDYDDLDLETFSPILSLGSKERRRQTEKTALEAAPVSDSNTNKEQDGYQDQSATPPSAGTRCLVLEAGSSMCRVDYQGQSLLCDIRGSVKDAQIGYVNPVAVGDWVLVNRTSTERGVVESLLPRRSILTRPHSPDQGKILPDLYQIVVANVDRLLIVASWREPHLWPALIDRYLIAAQRNQIEAVICINKIDLVEDWAEFDQVVDVYKNLEYQCILTSAVSMQGIAPLKDLLREGTSVLAGLSGVGKSTLLTAVEPSLQLKTAKVSEKGLYTGQGRHTTTQASLWRLENGGVVIDTPGIRSFELADIQPRTLSSWYPEMVPHIPNCRFSDCTHLNEPACAVKSAVEKGAVSPLRYKNYTQLLDELKLE